jgi:acyl-CoA dehydrogenase
MPALETFRFIWTRTPIHLEPGTTAWRCRICGHVHYGDEAPEECPYCFPKSAFKKV